MSGDCRESGIEINGSSDYDTDPDTDYNVNKNLKQNMIIKQK
ncbi:MAG: hypothetical protein P8078_06585 [bacterium]